MMESLSARLAIKTGFDLAKKNIKFYLVLMLVWFVVGVLLSSISDSLQANSQWLSSFVGFISSVFNTFITLGMLKAALNQVDGKEFPLKSAFSFEKENIVQLVKLFVGNLVAGLLIALGFILLIIPGIYLLLRLYFVPFLIAEKSIWPIEAIKQSFALSKGNLGLLFRLGLISLLVIILGALLLVIGLFWAIPTVYLAGAFVYRKLSKPVGVSSTPAQAPKPTTQPTMKTGIPQGTSQTPQSTFTSSPTTQSKNIV